MQQVEEVARKIASYMNGYKVIVNKCTVPVGTARKIKQIIENSHSSNNTNPTNPGNLSIYNPCKNAKHTDHCESPSSSQGKDSFPPTHREDPHISGSCEEPSSFGSCEEPSYSGSCEDYHPPVIARSEATKQSQFSSLSSPSPLRRDSSSNPSPSKEDTPSNPSPSKEDTPSNPSPLRGEGRVRVKQPFDIISNPEFLREGSAVYDFTHPDKIVIGYETEKAKQVMQEIYRPLYLLDTPFVFTFLETAEMIKYACNAFLATKITFINEIANFCDRAGADVHPIAKAMGMDGRISPKFLHPGPGYGGSCYPTDTRALYAIASNEKYDFKLIKAVIGANSRQREFVIEKIEKALGNLQGKNIAILGLAFKQNTDDIRESAAIDIIKNLLAKGANIQCFDPMAMENTRKILPDLIFCSDEYETARNGDALVILTEWNQFRNLDLHRLKSLINRLIIIDSKNLYEPCKAKELGFTYIGMGRC